MRVLSVKFPHLRRPLRLQDERLFLRRVSRLRDTKKLPTLLFWPRKIPVLFACFASRALRARVLYLSYTL